MAIGVFAYFTFEKGPQSRALRDAQDYLNSMIPEYADKVGIVPDSRLQSFMQYGCSVKISYEQFVTNLGVKLSVTESVTLALGDLGDVWLNARDITLLVSEGRRMIPSSADGSARLNAFTIQLTTSAPARGIANALMTGARQCGGGGGAPKEPTQYHRPGTSIGTPLP